MSDIVWKSVRDPWGCGGYRVGFDRTARYEFRHGDEGKIWTGALMEVHPATNIWNLQYREIAQPEDKPDDWQPCERTVRACIEALPRAVPGIYKDGDEEVVRATAFNDCSRALEALIAKPDPERELAKELYGAAYPNGDGLPNNGLADGWFRAARHLINTERLRP